MRAFGTPLHGFIWVSVPKNNAPHGEHSGTNPCYRLYSTFSVRIKALLHCKKPDFRLCGGEILLWLGNVGDAAGIPVRSVARTWLGIEFLELVGLALPLLGVRRCVLLDRDVGPGLGEL